MHQPELNISQHCHKSHLHSQINRGNFPSIVLFQQYANLMPGVSKSRLNTWYLSYITNPENTNDRNITTSETRENCNRYAVLAPG